MKKFQVITDSTSDVEKKYREEFDLDYVQMGIIQDDKEYKACLDWSEISPEVFYTNMRNGSRGSTTLVSTGEFEKHFMAALDKGLDVLYIACSSKLSGSVNNGKIVADELKEKYPDRKIVCLDSLRSNYAEGLMAIDAGKMALEGKDIDEVVAYLEENKLCYQTFATVGKLDWLKRAGRIKASSAFFGNLLGVKPIIVGDAEGNNFGFKKVKGRKNSLDEVINYVCERCINPAEATIFVEHADCLKDAEYVANAIKERINPKCINISYLGPIIGSSVGPDSITVNFFGQKVEIASGE